jgi:hypothetical protein
MQEIGYIWWKWEKQAKEWTVRKASKLRSLRQVVENKVGT